jgi:hypothetical protein
LPATTCAARIFATSSSWDVGGSLIVADLRSESRWSAGPSSSAVVPQRSESRDRRLSFGIVRTPDGIWAEAQDAIRRALDAAAGRPVCVVGPSGSGKTTHLRAVFAADERAPVWTTARDTVDSLVAAMRQDPAARWQAAFTDEPRPVVVEHLEDMRGRLRTMDVLRDVFEMRASLGHRTVLSLTLGPGAEAVLAWVKDFADVIPLQ